MADDFTLNQISADGINENFATLKKEIETKADLNGDSTQRFKVADAVDAMEAVNKEQLDGSVATVNSEIAKLETEIGTKADKTYVDTNLALKANKSDVDAALATKLDKSDATVTKQGNTFNGAGQLVQLDANGKLPAVDGSQLTNITANLSNLTPADKSTVLSLGMPDYSNYITTWVNNTTYTVPKDGFVSCMVACSTGSSSYYYYNGVCHMLGYSSSDNNQYYLFLPIKKGSTIKISASMMVYCNPTGSSQIQNIMFIPMLGAS